MSVYSPRANQKNVDIAKAGSGWYGCTCTCPNGQTYQVGDNSDLCDSLRCAGGKSGKCTHGDGAWDGRGAICAQPYKPIVKTKDCAFHAPYFGRALNSMLPKDLAYNFTYNLDQTWGARTVRTFERTRHYVCSPTLERFIVSIAHSGLPITFG